MLQAGGVTEDGVFLRWEGGFFLKREEPSWQLGDRMNTE